MSASIEGVREVWARSLREKKYQLLASRVRTVGPFLDETYPIAFVGYALLSEIGSVPGDLVASSRVFRNDVTAGWRAIAGSGISEDDWQRIGGMLQDEITAEEAVFLSQVRWFREMEKTAAKADRDCARFRLGLARGTRASTEPSLRTPVELVEDSIARCEPWSAGGKLVAAAFRREPREQLSRRQLAWRAALGVNG
jgi:hypothetical protein